MQCNGKIGTVIELVQRGTFGMGPVSVCDSNLLVMKCTVHSM